MYLCSLLHGHGTSVSPGASGAPTECTHGTNGPSVPSTSNTARPMRVISFMLTTTYGLSEISMPMCAMWLPSGPIEKGTTYMVRPRMQPPKRPLQRHPHLRGRHPVVGRPRVLLPFAADERAVLDARDVGGIRQREIAVRAPGRIQSLQRSGGDHLGAQARVLDFAAVAPDDAIRLGQLRNITDPRQQARMANVCRRGRRWRRGRTAIRIDSWRSCAEWNSEGAGGGTAPRDGCGNSKVYTSATPSRKARRTRRSGQAALPISPPHGDPSASRVYGRRSRRREARHREAARDACTPPAPRASPATAPAFPCRSQSMESRSRFR